MTCPPRHPPSCLSGLTGSGFKAMPKPDRTETVSIETAFQGRTVSVQIARVRKPNGRMTTREIVQHKDAVVMVPVDGNGNVLLVRQYRTSIGRELLELPAGGIDPGENPEDSARRELREETGYMPRKLTSLGGFYASPGFCTEYLHLFLAGDLELSPLEASDTEEIEVVPVTLRQARELIVSGQIMDAKSVAGLLRVLALPADC